MSSNIQVQRICEFCGKEFTARKTVTRCCSDNCSKRAYKAKLRAAKIDTSDKETKTIRLQPLEYVKAKDFLTVKDTAQLLNCSIRTAYRLIGQGVIKSINLAQRKTLVRRSDIDSMFAQSMPEGITEPIQYSVSECYNMAEIQDKYSISGKALSSLIKRDKIPTIQQGKYSFAPKSIIDKIFNHDN